MEEDLLHLLEGAEPHEVAHHAGAVVPHLEAPGFLRDISPDDLDVADVADADWEASFQLNLMSHIRATAAALPHLRASDQARIVYVDSTAGKRPSGGMPDYSVMKAALLSYSKLVSLPSASATSTTLPDVS